MGMILSMTGFGTASLQKEGTSAVVEIRTGNHRFLDLHIRLAREYAFLEPEIAQTVRRLLLRGRIDVHVGVQAEVPANCLVNVETARSYVEAAEKLKQELQLDGSLNLNTLLVLPGVAQNQNSSIRDQASAGSELRDFVLEAVRQALETVCDMRRREGQALESAMRGCLRDIREKVASVHRHIPSVSIEYKERLEERLKVLFPQSAPDPQRLAQEVALLAERSDISEEITRLESHTDQFSGLLDDGREVGKKMDFLLQEMHREVNTVLSKTGHLEVTRLGIAMKADIEKLREQAQNVE